MAASAIAQTNYFPLATGYQWVYRADGRAGASAVTVEITQQQVFQGKEYFLVEGLPQQSRLWLRSGPDGAVWMWNESKGAESIWIDFSAPPQVPFQPGSDPCSSSASIESRQAKYEGPAGAFDNALSIGYRPGGCADAGLARDVFLPSVGLVQRTYLTIAGPRTYDLIYARLGSTVIGAGESGFSLMLDKPIYWANLMPPIDPDRAAAVMTARLTVRNTSSEPLELSFSSSQRYNIRIYDGEGRVVYNWAASRLFMPVVGREVIQGEKNWVESIPLGDGARPLPEGRYAVVAELLSEGKPYWAAAHFEVRHAH